MNKDLHNNNLDTKSNDPSIKQSKKQSKKKSMDQSKNKSIDKSKRQTKERFSEKQLEDQIKNSQLNKTILQFDNDVEDDLNNPMDCYMKAVALFETIPCMTLTNSKIEMYRDMKQQFLDLGTFQDAAQYAQQCEQLEQETKSELIEFTYKKNKGILKDAKTRQDYEDLKKSYHKMNGYLDSQKLERQCKNELKKFDKKDRVYKIKWIVAVLFLAVLIIVSHTSYGKYNIARGFHKLTIYEKSAQMYKNLGSYKDSKDRYHESIYRQALRQEKKGNLDKARELFYQVSTYSDSSEHLIKMEKELLNMAQIGDQVTIGKFLWFVLDKQDGQVLLMKNAPIKEIEYNSEETEVTWETSDLRNYLNDTFLNQYFCEAEIANILMIQNQNVNNIKYDTQGGNNTIDQLFVLSEEEIASYESIIIDKGKKNFWLRTPGGLSCAACVYEKKQLNSYGEVVNSDEISAYPVFWYSVQ